MKIESPRYGSIEVAPERILEFPRGLPGFEDLRRFSLFHPEGGEPAYYILQSLEMPEVAFHVADPARFGFDYRISLNDEEAGVLALASPDDAVVVVMLLRDRDEGGREGPLRANLKGPLILNVAARRGLQHVFERLDFAVN